VRVSGNMPACQHERTWDSQDARRSQAPYRLPGIEVSVDGQPVTELPTLRRFWAAEVERRKAGGPGGTTRRGLCLVCAREGTLLNTLPQLVPRRLVPLYGNDASLVSGNEPIHTYDFSTGPP